MTLRNVSADFPQSTPVGTARQTGERPGYTSSDDFYGTKSARRHRHVRNGDHSRRGRTRSCRWALVRNAAQSVYRRSGRAALHVLLLPLPSSHHRQLSPL